MMGSVPASASPDPDRASPVQAAGDTPAAVAMRSITKQFDSVTALDGVDLTLNSGEIHAVLGENGAGKSTLMHVLAGEIRPTSGTIHLTRTPIAFNSPKDARKAGIAMVHQHFMLAPALSVSENLALDASDPSGNLRDRLISRVHFSALHAATPALEQAKRLGWVLNPDAEVSTLSVGQQQRIEIVKALAADANILIFDEPTAVLNAEEIDELFAVLRLLRQENKTIVLIAHKLAEIFAVADRVTVLRKGKFVSTLPITETNAVELAQLMVGDAPVSAVIPNLIDMQTLSTASTSRTETVCKATAISVRGNRGEQTIHGLNLEVLSGEIFGIGGVDGNGQIELGEVLAGLRVPESGDLVINSTATGYIPQDRRRSGLAVSMSLLAITFCSRPHRIPSFRVGPLLKLDSLRSVARNMIREYDIRTPSSSTLASTLSGGNQQKIIVARALRPKPDFVVAINPTRGLDIGATRFVHEQLRKARDRGAGVVVISTDLDELAAIADRTAILSGGVLTPFIAGKNEIW